MPTSDGGVSRPASFKLGHLDRFDLVRLVCKLPTHPGYWFSSRPHSLASPTLTYPYPQPYYQFRRSCRGPTRAQSIYYLSLATNIYDYRSTNVYGCLLTNSARPVFLVRANLALVYKYLRYITREAGPLYTSGYFFLGAWATHYRHALRARAAFQILTLFDHRSLFSIIVVRNAGLMLMGCHVDVVTCVLIVDAVLRSLPLDPKPSTPVNHGRTHSRAYTMMVGRRAPLKLQTTLPAPSISFHPNCMAPTTARLRDHDFDLAAPSLLRGRTIEGFCPGSTSGAPHLERECIANNEQ